MKYIFLISVTFMDYMECSYSYFFLSVRHRFNSASVNRKSYYPTEISCCHFHLMTLDVPEYKNRLANGRGGGREGAACGVETG
jgi:hypothetical protein